MQQNPNAGLLAQFPGHVMNVRNNRQQNAGGNIHNRNRDLVGHLDAQEHRQNDQIRQIAAARNARGTNTLAKTKTLKVLCEIASHTNVLGQNLADQVQEAVRGETRNLLAAAAATSSATAARSFRTQWIHWSLGHSRHVYNPCCTTTCVWIIANSDYIDTYRI